MPSRCPVAGDDFGSEVVVRQLFYGRRRYRYRILFAVKGDTVQVLRVCAMGPARRFAADTVSSHGFEIG